MFTSVYQSAHRVRRAFSRLTNLAIVPAAAVLFGSLCASAVAQNAIATTTSLSTSAGLSPQGQPVTLTATVTNATKGELGFCDITLTPHCLSSDLFDIRQLSPNGTASVLVIPSVGIHQYRAVFVGYSDVSTLTDWAPSFNTGATTVQVSGPFPTTTTIAANNGSPTLTVTVAGSGSQSVSPTGTVKFLQGTTQVGTATLSGGTFGQTFPASVSTLSGSFTTVASADLNNDGYPDLVLQSGTTIVPAFGTGASGTFTMGTAFTASMTATRVLVYDFNSDGSPDIVVSSASGSQLYTNNGSGVFSASGSTTLQAMGLGDFNYDGIPDLIGPAVGNSSAVQVAYGANGTWTLATTTTALPAGSTVTDMAGTDVNGDPVLDEVAVGTTGANSFAWTLTTNPLTGTFKIGTTPLGSAAPTKVVAVDFNADKIQDIAVLSASGITFALGQSSGVVGSTNVPASTGMYAVGSTTTTTGSTLLTADLNGDGRPDFVVGGSAGTTIYFGTGGAGSAGSTSLSTSASTGVVLADANADGVTDVINVAGSSTITAYDNILGSSATATGTVTPTCTGTQACNYNITAAYQGDTNFGASTSAPTSVTVQPYSDTITANSTSTNTSQTQVQIGAAVSYTNAIAPTGTPTFVVSGNGFNQSYPGVCSPQGTNILGCDVYINPSVIGTGTYKIVASLSADSTANGATAHYGAITSDPNANGTLTITAGSTPTINVPSGQTYSAAGGTATLIASVVGTNGVAPTGTVYFSVDGGPGQIATCSQNNATSTATCTYNYNFTAGTANHTLVVSITALGSYNAASSGQATITSQAAPKPTVTTTITGTPTISLSSGGTVFFSLSYSQAAPTQMSFNAVLSGAGGTASNNAAINYFASPSQRGSVVFSAANLAAYGITTTGTYTVVVNAFNDQSGTYANSSSAPVTITVTP